MAFISVCCIAFAQNAFSQKVNVPSDAEIYAKIEVQLSQMTLAEKVGMLHANSSFTSTGVPRLNIPELTMSDGPHGVRPEHGRDWKIDNDNVPDSGTYLPTGVCLASTWNTDLGYQFGSVLGKEANARGKDVILGPGINIIRTPLNGRNFEYQSEDPYLVSRLAVGYIKGVQDQGVAACVKHYIANNQEVLRDKINVLISDRALREIYLPGFKAAVQEAGVYTLMGAYNKFRGQWCAENDYLLNKLLKQELGFKGLVVSDWGAIHNTLEALWSGTDLEMGTDLAKVDYPNFFLGDTVIALVKNGVIDEALIDDKVKRILYVMHKIHMFGNRPAGAFATKENFAVAKKVAEEGIVLLKNSNQMLPLQKAKIRSMAVIGANATQLQSMGGGSSQVRTKYEITPFEGLKNLSAGAFTLSFSPGFKVKRNAKADAAMIKEAVKAASEADIAVVVGGWVHGYDFSKWSDNAYDAEGADKPDMEMPFGQNELIEAVLKANPNTIIVLMGGGPINMSKWVDKAPAIIQAWYPGSEGGNALAEIIFGLVNPSGKLPMTFPKTLEQSPAHSIGQYPGDNVNVYYKDDIFVGYRYFDTYKVSPLFAFGHGLSYTKFDLSDYQVTPGNQSAQVTLTLTNSGKVAGAEVVQLYVKDDVSSLRRPEKELKGFEKVYLQPGESKKVTFSLPKEAFQYYNDIKHEWVLEPGAFTIMVGNSSANIWDKKKISL